jgi:hypothetical protein
LEARLGVSFRSVIEGRDAKHTHALWLTVASTTHALGCRTRYAPAWQAVVGSAFLTASLAASLAACPAAAGKELAKEHAKEGEFDSL